MLLEKERTKVIEIARATKKEKLVPLTFGNFSLRDSKSGYVCITPSGMPYDTLHPSDIVVVNLDGTIIEGERKPSIELGLHLAIYKRRKDVNGIVHQHSTYCTAWACVEGGMPCITSEAAALVGGKVNVAPFCPPGSEELAVATSETLGKDGSVLMGNHGAVCVAADIDTALRNAIILEESAKVTYLAYQINANKVNTLEEKMCEYLKKDTEQNYGQ
ncbi:MAG: class II aldolase/adducin family protein [Erysipelotrichaceae bacterium]